MATAEEIVAVAIAVRFKIAKDVSFSCDGEGLTIGGIDLAPVSFGLSREHGGFVVCDMLWIEHRIGQERHDSQNIGLALSELSGLGGILDLQYVDTEDEE